MMDRLLGRTLGDRYRFEELLGEGTFASVFRITDLHRRATLAAKVLRSDFSQDPSLLERFEREAVVLSRLQHPNIVRYYDIIKVSNYVFILMDYIPGRTLETILNERQEPFKPAAALDYLAPLTAALHFAHHEGIIHRDLKPANILLHENGTLYVTDFGIARLLHIASTLTQQGAPIGTPYYMAPEQITGQPVTVATDIYALGILLYRMLTGQLPFRGDSGEGGKQGLSARVTYEQVHVAPQPPARLRPNLSTAVQDVILRSLDKDPARRFQSVGDLYDALAEAVGAPPLMLDAPPQDFDDSRPDLPEWSSFVAPPAPEDTPPNPIPAVEVNLEQERTAELLRPPQRRKTRPHLEEEINRERALYASRPPTIPALPYKPATPAYTPPHHPPAPRRPSPGLTIALAAVGTLAVLLALCAGLVYVVRSFGSTNGGGAQGPAGPVQNVPPPAGAAAAPDQITPAVPAGERGGTRIAFTSERGGSQDIYVINVNGSGLQQITSSPGDERGPAWSPDGTQIAFYGAPNGGDTQDIYVVNVDGSGMRNLTNSPDAEDRYPTWSPDGTRLAFHSDADGDFDIYTINLDGSGLRQLTQNRAADLGPDWSPDGTRIVYHTDLWGYPYQIALIDVATLDVRRLTNTDAVTTFPTWSPDGTQIAFNSIRRDTLQASIALMAADGSGVQTLSGTQGRSAFPDWSPDGRFIVYQEGVEGVAGVSIIPVTGGTPQTLLPVETNFLPDWEPIYR